MASSGVKKENNSIRVGVQWKKSKLNLFEKNGVQFKLGDMF